MGIFSRLFKRSKQLRRGRSLDRKNRVQLNLETLEAREMPAMVFAGSPGANVFSFRTLASNPNMAQVEINGIDQQFSLLGVDKIELHGSDDGNRFVVADLPVGMELDLFGGAGNDVFVLGGDNADVMLNSMNSLQGHLVLVGGGGQDIVRLNDQGTSTGSISTDIGTFTCSNQPTFTISNQGIVRDNLYSTGFFGQRSYQGQTTPEQTVVDLSSDLQTIEINGGSSGTTYNVQSNASVLINAGAADDNTVHVGSVDSPLASVGPVTVNGGGHTHLFIHDEANANAVNYTITSHDVCLLDNGQAVATVNYSGIEDLILNGGKGNNGFFVYDTNPATTTTLNANGAVDQFILAGVGSNYGTMNGIQGELYLNGRAQANDYVTFYDWGQTEGQTYHIGADTLTRSGMATVHFGGLSEIIQYGGQGNDTYFLDRVVAGPPVYIADAGGYNTLQAPRTYNTWINLGNSTRLNAGTDANAFFFSGIENVIDPGQAIFSLWNAMGGEQSVLGSPLSNVLDTPEGGSVVHFQGGDIYSGATAGTHALIGPIAGKFAATATMKDAYGTPVLQILGLPTSDELPAANGGRVNHFQGGDIYWSGTEAYVVYGAIWGKYQQSWTLKDAYGTPVQQILGLPTSDELPAANGGRVNHFQGGDIYWSGSEAHVVYGAIRDEWAALGGAGGTLGYPTSDETAVDNGGRLTQFEHGQILWTPDGVVRVLDFIHLQYLELGDASHVAPFLDPAIIDKWHSLGGLTGVLGMPTTTTLSTPDGTGLFNRFQNGAIYSHNGNICAIYNPTIVRFFPVRHSESVGIFDKWASTGYELGPLGYPIGDVKQTSDGGWECLFESGGIFWQRDTGVFEVNGLIFKKYWGWNLGQIADYDPSYGVPGYYGPQGILGYPISDEITTHLPDGSKVFTSYFQNGFICFEECDRQFWVGQFVPGSHCQEWKYLEKPDQSGSLWDWIIQYIPHPVDTYGTGPALPGISC